MTPFTLRMRTLHRYIGFFVIGLTIIYSISGTLMLFRTSDFLKSEITVNKTIATGLNAEQIGQNLHKKLKIVSEDAQIISFKNGEYDGTYSKSTGDVSYKSKELPVILQKMEKLHKTTTNSPLYFLNLLYGLMLLFLAVSPFWMYSAKSRFLKKGAIVSALGAVTAMVLVIL